MAEAWLRSHRPTKPKPTRRHRVAGAQPRQALSLDWMEAASIAHRSSTMHPTFTCHMPDPQTIPPRPSAGAVLRERSGRRAGHAEQAGRAPGRPRAPCRLPLGVVCIARSAAQRAAAPAGAQFWVSCGARRWPPPQLCPALAVSVCTLPPPCPLFLAVTLSVWHAACHLRRAMLKQCYLRGRRQAGWGEQDLGEQIWPQAAGGRWGGDSRPGRWPP